MLQFLVVYCNSTNPDNFEENLPDGLDCWEVLLTATPMLFCHDGEWKKYPPNQVVIFPPNSRIHYKACDGQYIDHWMRFYTDEPYVTDSNLPLADPFPVQQPDYLYKLMDLLALEHFYDTVSHSPYSPLSEDHLLHCFFTKLQENQSAEPESSQIVNLNNLRSQIYAHPEKEWSVEYMAELMHMSTGHLQRLYKDYFHTSCMNDLIHQRITLASKKLLRGSTAISDIALSCGYHNVEHFCRQFRKHMGCTPREYRQNNTPVSDS